MASFCSSSSCQRFVGADRAGRHPAAGPSCSRVSPSVSVGAVLAAAPAVPVSPFFTSFRDFMDAHGLVVGGGDGGRKKERKKETKTQCGLGGRWEETQLLY